MHGFVLVAARMEQAWHVRLARAAALRRARRPAACSSCPAVPPLPPPAPWTAAVDANQLAELVVVGANGSLHQRGLFVDDCMLPAMPLLCFAVGADEGSLMMDQLVRIATSL